MDYNYHTVSQLSDTIAPNINLTSSKMKQFWVFYGVDKIIFSPFCKAFENFSDLRDELLLY